MTEPTVRDAWAAFERLGRRKRKRRAKRILHKFTRRERQKKSTDEWGRRY